MSKAMSDLLMEVFTAIASLAILYLVRYAVGYLKEKKDEITSKIGSSNYDYIYKVAESIHDIVEQQFKDDLNVSLSKKLAFNTMLSSKIPELSEDDIAHFREAVVGKNNKDKFKNFEYDDTLKYSEPEENDEPREFSNMDKKNIFSLNVDIDNLSNSARMQAIDDGDK